MNIKKIAAAGAVVVALTATVAGCKDTSGDGSKAKAAATSTAVKADEQTAQQLIKPCIPKDQLTLATKSGVKKMATCVGVPKQNVHAFEEAALTAAEHTPHILSGSSAGKTARHTYLNTTLPKLVQQYRS